MRFIDTSWRDCVRTAVPYVSVWARRRSGGDRRSPISLNELHHCIDPGDKKTKTADGQAKYEKDTERSVLKEQSSAA